MVLISQRAVIVIDHHRASTTVLATGRFGDGGCKCVMRKKCVFLEYF